jgi:hypothetical protein
MISGLLLFSASSYGGLVGTTLSYEAIYQSSPTSEISRIGTLTTAEVSATEVEFPMLGELDTNVPGVYLVNASLDVGDNYLEFDYSNAGSGSFLAGHQNTVILTFNSAAAIAFTSAEVDYSVTNIALSNDDLTFIGNQLFINHGDGGSFNPSSFSRINLTTVPIPAAGWLFVAGLGMIGAISRKKHNHHEH